MTAGCGENSFVPHQKKAPSGKLSVVVPGENVQTSELKFVYTEKFEDLKQRRSATA